LACAIASRTLLDVSKRARIPPEFKLRPFSLNEALEAGLTLDSLRGKTWRRISARLYRWNEMPEDPWLTLQAWRRVLPSEAVFSGATAAWLFGIVLNPTDPVEIQVPQSARIRTRSGLLVRHCETPSAEVIAIRGLRATALPLTLMTLCLQRPAVEALIAIDNAIHLGLTDPVALAQYAEAAKGRYGVPRLKSLASFAAPAESPMETRLRWLLIRAGLPPPVVQANLQDSAARFLGRADLYYPQSRLVLEYDGGNHRERLVEDDRRQNLLVNASYQLLRFTAADIYGRADVVVAQVRAALAKRV
jgi:very-short-patch-repair endonuclease